MSAPQKLVRILIADDFQPSRDFIRSQLERGNWWVIGEVSDGLAAVQQAIELEPDLVLVDLALPFLDGIQAATRIRRAVLKARILFISECDDPVMVRAALGSGAMGYLLKKDMGAELVSAVEAILDGKLFVSEGLGGLGAYL